MDHTESTARPEEDDFQSAPVDIEQYLTAEMIEKVASAIYRPERQVRLMTTKPTDTIGQFRVAVIGTRNKKEVEGDYEGKAMNETGAHTTQKSNGDRSGEADDHDFSTGLIRSLAGQPVRGSTRLEALQKLLHQVERNYSLMDELDAEEIKKAKKAEKEAKRKNPATPIRKSARVANKTAEQPSDKVAMNIYERRAKERRRSSTEPSQAAVVIGQDDGAGPVGEKAQGEGEKGVAGLADEGAQGEEEEVVAGPADEETGEVDSYATGEYMNGEVAATAKSEQEGVRKTIFRQHTPNTEKKGTQATLGRGSNKNDAQAVEKMVEFEHDDQLAIGPGPENTHHEVTAFGNAGTDRGMESEAAGYKRRSEAGESSEKEDEEAEEQPRPKRFKPRTMSTASGKYGK
ncbi:hypothetical protein BDV95DRAFT_592079 [Massariosphaeria phaeospora]|uniref:Uncharacterized protein n=1 Tax=Massariosphaeria phaeospora TaxID=100035 RepID=A0A7C8ME01_9PLEO|nr:hypothetical protein BDV95DRAFT_592079 [Massariosphaeria phaeospora]